MKKSSLLLLVSLLATVTLTACAKKNEEVAKDFSFYAMPTPSAEAEIPTALSGTLKPTDAKKPELVLPTADKLKGSQAKPQNTNPQGVVMKKSLSDFDAVTAKEVTIVTSKGSITFDVFQDKVPLTVANFLTLAKSGFYNGVRFHRVIADFMAQVGDPLSKDEAQQAYWGTGGPGYVIPDEFDSSLKFDGEGVVAMANAGPNTGGSQFFITYAATPWLDGKHAIFGKVTKGMDVLRNITVGDTIQQVTYK